MFGPLYPTIVAATRGLTSVFNSATRVSIFVDVSRSMPEGTVAAAYNLLVSELESAGKTLVSSTSNQEDYLLSFCYFNCCPNEFAEPLQQLFCISTCAPASLQLINRSVSRRTGLFLGTRCVWSY